MSERKSSERHKGVPKKWREMRRKFRAQKTGDDTTGDLSERPSWLQPLRRIGYRNVQKGPGNDMI